MSSNQISSSSDLKKLKTAKLKKAKEGNTKVTRQKRQKEQQLSVNNVTDLNSEFLSTLPESSMLRRPREFEKATTQQHAQHFDELVDMLIACHPTSRFADLHNNSIDANTVPTLQIGFIARAMGLNVTNDQVVLITELVEDDGPSRGVVNREKLKRVIINALTTGVIGADTPPQQTHATTKAHTNMANSALWSGTNDKTLQTSRICTRADEEHIFRALETLDVKRKGYLEPDEVRLEMMSMGERFTEEEWENMRMMMVDPESDVINYKEFADFLARS